MRILQTVDTVPLAAGFQRILDDPLSAAVTWKAIHCLRVNAVDPDGVFATLAAQAVGVLADPSTIATSLAFLTEDLLQALDRRLS